MVGTRVDDEGDIRQHLGVLRGLTVRQGEEDDVMAGEDLGRRVLQGEVRERAQVRLMVDERLPGVGVRRDGADLDLGVSGEQAEDLAARIAGSAGDGDRDGHGFNLIVWEERGRNGDTCGALREAEHSGRVA